MKILMTSHYTLPHRGGIETIVEKLSLGLTEKGHEVHIVSSKIAGQDVFDLPHRRILGIPAFDPLKRHGVHYPIFYPTLFWKLIREVHWADLVHSQGMLYLTTLGALVFARLQKRPAILTEHAGFVSYNRPFLNFIQAIAVYTIGKLSIMLSDFVIVPDSIVQQILEKHLRVSPNKIFCIPLGVDTTLFHPLDDEEKRILRSELGWNARPKVLFVGNYVARKRISLLLESRSERFDVILCGEGYDRASLPADVICYPPLAHEHLAKLYQAADLFVVPSSVETFAIVAYEAMACGLPVVMTDDLRHLAIGKSGLVQFVAPNPDDLRRIIHHLLNSPEERYFLGKKSAEWVQTHFSWERTLDEHLKLYHLLVEAQNE